MEYDNLQLVKPFYDYWENYFTAKSYVWVEKYDTRDAPDRRVRRIMEAENKKLRDAARKERNEEVRVRMERGSQGKNGMRKSG
jgi:DnaJ family protein A protein 5